MPGGLPQNAGARRPKGRKHMTHAMSKLGRVLYAAVALLLTLGGGLSAVDRAWQAAHLPAVWHGTAVGSQRSCSSRSSACRFRSGARSASRRASASTARLSRCSSPICSRVCCSDCARRAARARDPVPDAARRHPVVAVCVVRLGRVHAADYWAYPTLSRRCSTSSRR